MPSIAKGSLAPVLLTLLLVLGGLGALATSAGDSRAPRATFYVATSGNDNTGDGSQGTPWATPAKAMNSISDGDTVLVGDGIYGGTTFSRAFTKMTTFKALNPYKARLTSATGRAVSVYGGNNITLEGFEMYGQAGASEYVIHISMPETHNITLRDNIIHDAYDNDILKVNDRCSDINITGNLMYNPFPTAAQGNQLMDINTVWDVNVEDNVLLNDYAWSGRVSNNQLSSFIVIKNSGTLKCTQDFRVCRNVFLNWDGRGDQPFLLLGEDAKTYHEAENVLVENNLFLGNSNIPIEAAFGIKCAKNVTFRSNTVTGDMPNGGWSYAYRINLESVNSPNNQDIFFYNNIWSDPMGTMNDFSDGCVTETSNGILHHNLYWNGGNPVPVDWSVLNFSCDNDSSVADPKLGSQAGLVLPRWNISNGNFVSGKSTIREEFVRLVELYGTPAGGSPAIDGAEPGNSPPDDILGNPRANQGSAPDFGALEHPNPMVFDLVITPQGIAPSSDAPVAGENIIINATVRNQGADNASLVDVAFYDGNPASGGVRIGTVKRIPKVPAGGLGNAEVSWNTTGKAGNHTIYVLADPNNTIAEVNESNNNASRSVTVEPFGALLRIIVTPPNATLTTDETRQFAAAGFDAFNNSVPLTPGWAVSGGGTVNATGLFSASKPGAWKVYANQSVISGSADITVTLGQLNRIVVSPPTVTLTTDDSQKFIATGYDTDGNVLDIIPDWGSTGGGRMGSDGTYTAERPGTWKVYANASGISGNATVFVTAGKLRRISIAPATATILAGQSQAFNANAFDADGNMLAADFAWSASGGGTIDAIGNYAGRVPGNWTVSAAAVGISASANITVLPGPLDRIVISPDNVTLDIGGSQQFCATGYDALGNIVQIAPRWWAKGGGSIDTGGKFTAATEGNWTISAIQDSIAGNASVAVRKKAPPVNQSDTDGDGLPDVWEQKYFGNLTYGPNDDPDRDNLTNLQEYLKGTDPAKSNLPVKPPVNPSLTGINRLLVVKSELCRNKPNYEQTS